MKCYVAGPMRGYARFNFPAFHSLAAFMRRHGWTVFNPAENDESVYPNIEQWPGFASGDTGQCPEFSLAVAMRWDLARITESDAIVFLPGWEQSSGAKTERMVAEACGCELLYAFPVDGTDDWFVSEVDIDQVGAV